MNLGDIASVATLILFAFYFIGRAITIFRFRGVFPDEIRMEAADFEKSGEQIVESYFLEENPRNAFVLTARQGIYDLSVYRILYDDSFHFTGRQKLEGMAYPFLNLGQSVEFLCTSPELLPEFEVVYYTPDYKKVTVTLWDNPKNGVMSESARPQNTLWSVLFHLFN